MNTYNENEDHLIQAIESYVCQNVELIISTIEGDKNDSIFKRYPVKVNRFKKEDHPGKSPLGSFLQLNAALKLITGEWFCFASSNDVALENKINQEVQKCLSTGKKVCYSSFYYTDSELNITEEQRFRDYDYQRHKTINFVSDCALIHRSLFKHLPFRTEYKNYAYWDFWLRVYEGEGNVFCYNPTPTWKYRQGAGMRFDRERNQEQVRQAGIDRSYMLSKHK